MVDLNALSLAQLAEQLLDSEEAARMMSLAAYEDAREIGDITTTSIINPQQAASGVLAARKSGVVAGLAVIERYLSQSSLTGALQPLMADGDDCTAGAAIARIECSLADMLLHERPALNFLGRLSGIASLTRAYVDAVAGTGAVICDTRKTTPGMRIMEKYAVRCGGGTLHRIGLYDAALFKDNHIAHIPPGDLAARLAIATRTVRQRHAVRFVEVEVDSLNQFEQVLSIDAGLIDMVLLDNMDTDQLRQAVTMRDAASSSIQLEASGGVDIGTVRSIAETGVDRIAVGGLTHASPWLDIGLDMELAP